MAQEESTSTVLVAGSANLLIAVAKLLAGLVSGSSAMLSEAAHSVGEGMRVTLRPAASSESAVAPSRT